MKAKKSLGQHFLKSKRAVAKIISIADLSKDDVVLEIGPGKGALTRALLESGARVIAVEKDAEMVEVLEKTFAHEVESGRLFLIHDDVLTFDPIAHGLQQERYKLIANIPYYITGEIIRRFLSEVAQPERMVVLVQKEVATRIVGHPERAKRVEGSDGKPLDKARGKESILSLSVKAYGTPKLVMTVPARDFAPPPQVDSAILSITDISHERLPIDKEERFFTIIKQAFSQKRKQLVKTVPPLVPQEALVGFLTQRKLPVTARPEELSFEDWMALVG